MDNFHLFDCQFDAEQLFLGGHCCLQGKEVLEKLFKEDFRKPRTLLLVHPKKYFAYYHEYVKSPQRKTYIIRVCNQRILKRAAAHFCTKLELDHPYLLVIVDLTGEHPRFMIEKCKYVAESAEEVALVLAHSLNIVLKSVGWKMKLKTRKEADYSVPLLLRTTIENCMRMPRTLEELYGADTIDRIMPTRKKEKKNTSDFRSAIILEDYADEILDLLHKLIKGKRNPKDIMRPFRAAIYAGMLGKITKSAFVNEFGDILGNSISAVCKYTNKKCRSYDDDPLFEKMKGLFLTVVKK